MGIHYCFGYVGYEITTLKTMIDLLDRFCTGCHTNDDVQGNCAKCEVGALVLKCKEYLLHAYESVNLKDEAKLFKRMKIEIKKIIPTPLTNNYFIFQDGRGRDEFYKLRELLKDIEFEDNKRQWRISSKIIENIERRLHLEYIKNKRGKKHGK